MHVAGGHVRCDQGAHTRARVVTDVTGAEALHMAMVGGVLGERRILCRLCSVVVLWGWCEMIAEYTHVQDCFQSCIPVAYFEMFTAVPMNVSYCTHMCAH
jgi:hypothetical protein